MKSKILALSMIVTVLSASNWEKVIMDEDPFTGKKIVGFLNTSNTKEKLGENITLIVRCGNYDYPEIMVNWNTFLHNKKVKMLERIISHNKEFEDKKSKIMSESQYDRMRIADEYSVSKDFTSLFYPNNNTLKSNYKIELKTKLYSLVNDKTLVLRVAPYNDNPITAKFNLSGLKKIISPYKEICHLPNKDEYSKMIQKMTNNLTKELEKYN